MITFWLVVAISVAGGPWQTMEDVQQADLTSCLSAVARRVQSAEEVRLYEQDGTPSRRDYEIAVTCSVHRSADDPA
jgi:hypothetical protein